MLVYPLSLDFLTKVSYTAMIANDRYEAYSAHVSIHRKE
jgi:hypothetical protein